MKWCKILHQSPSLRAWNVCCRCRIPSALGARLPPIIHTSSDNNNLFVSSEGFEISPASATLGFTQEQPQQLQLTHHPSELPQIIKALQSINKAIIKSFSWYYFNSYALFLPRDVLIVVNLVTIYVNLYIPSMHRCDS